MSQYKITKEQVKHAQRLLESLGKRLPKTEKGSEFYLTMPNVIRFALARDFNEKDAGEMFLKWVEWYESFRPDLIREDEFKAYHQTGKVRVLGLDREGCPVFWIRMRYGVKGLADSTTVLRYMIWNIEQAIAKAEALGKHRFTVVHDRLGNYEAEEESKQAMKQFSPILSDNYPERLSLYIVLGVNWFFRAAFKVVSVFMSKKTTEKVRILASLQEMCEFIELKQQLEDYGGPLQPDCSKFVPLEDTKLNSEEVEAMRKDLK